MCIVILTKIIISLVLYGITLMAQKYVLIHVTASGAVPFALLFFFVVVFCLRFLTDKPTPFFVSFVLVSRSQFFVRVLPVAFLFILLLVRDAPVSSSSFEKGNTSGSAS
jgi:hypothetical protein